MKAAAALTACSFTSTKYWIERETNCTTPSLPSFSSHYPVPPLSLGPSPLAVSLPARERFSWEGEGDGFPDSAGDIAFAAGAGGGVFELGHVPAATRQWLTRWMQGSQQRDDVGANAAA